MSWKIVERKIGQGGDLKRCQKRQREWGKKYGDNWMIGYRIEGESVSQQDAWDSIYYESYRAHFETHPDDLQELIDMAKMLKNPHSELTGGVDLQVPAIMEYLDRNGLQLAG